MKSSHPTNRSPQTLSDHQMNAPARVSAAFKLGKRACQSNRSTEELQKTSLVRFRCARVHGPTSSNLKAIPTVSFCPFERHSVLRYIVWDVKAALQKSCWRYGRVGGCKRRRRWHERGRSLASNLHLRWADLSLSPTLTVIRNSKNPSRDARPSYKSTIRSRRLSLTVNCDANRKPNFRNFKSFRTSDTKTINVLIIYASLFRNVLVRKTLRRLWCRRGALMP